MSGAAMGGLIGSAMGMISQSATNARNERVGKEMMGMQLENQKELNAYNNELAMDMWNKTNYGAQMEHMKKAGVNPALLYGMKGGGGVTTNTQGGSASAGSIPNMPNPLGGMGMAIQSAADVALKEAQTRNLDAQTEKTKGADTDVANATVTKLGQDAETGAAEEQFTKAKTAMQTMQNTEQLATQEERIQHVKTNAYIALEEMQIAKNERKISDATYNEQIKIVEQESIQALLKNELTAEQTRAISQQLAQEWERLSGQVTQRDIERAKVRVTWELGKMGIEQRKAEMIANATTDILRGSDNNRHRNADRNQREIEHNDKMDRYDR